MWADTLFLIERGHVLRMGVWAAMSLGVGIALLAWLKWRNDTAPFIKHFAVQSAAWGAIECAIALAAWRDLAFRSFASAIDFQQLLRLSVGLDAGYVVVGMTLALVAWNTGRRHGGVGAGVGIIIQGLALFALHVRLLALIGTLR